MSLNRLAVENYNFPLLSRSSVKMILKVHKAVQQSKVACQNVGTCKMSPVEAGSCYIQTASREDFKFYISKL